MLPEHDGKNWETEEELLPSGHQAPKLELGLITFTRLNLINCKIFTILHHPYCCYVYTRYNLFAHSSCTYLLILLFTKSTVYCIAKFILLHILLYFSYFKFLPIFIYIILCCVTYFALSIDLTYISLLIISCIIEYVRNKKNLEPWTLAVSGFNSHQLKKKIWKWFQQYYYNSCDVDITLIESEWLTKVYNYNYSTVIVIIMISMTVAPYWRNM